MTFRAPHHVLYDGDCGFCRFSIANLKRLDWLGKLDYVNVRIPDEPVVRDVPVGMDRLTAEMHVWPAHRRTLYHGFGAIRWLAWRLPLLWLIAPLMYLPLAPWLGQKAYLWVARNRFKLMPCHNGACEIQKRGPTSSKASS